MDLFQEREGDQLWSTAEKSQKMSTENWSSDSEEKL